MKWISPLVYLLPLVPLLPLPWRILLPGGTLRARMERVRRISETLQKIENPKKEAN